MTTSCPHPESAVVSFMPEVTVVDWCRLCGSVRVNNDSGGPEVPADEWVSPSGLVLPGWTCAGCGAFCGSEKELLTECRGCGAARG